MSNFSGTEPGGQKKTLSARAQSAAEMDGFVGSNFSSTPPGAPVCGCAFGSTPAQVAQAAALFSGPSIPTQVSEAVGEMGALHVLKETLAARGQAFDPSLLHVFAGANSFNMVYFDAKPPNATSAIILEAKGGSSTLGSRNNIARNGRVRQGTPAYANTLIQVMSQTKAKGAKGDERRAVGKQLRRIQNNRKAAMAAQPGTPVESKILYAGVATKYDKSRKLVHDPVLIFATKL